MTQTPDNADTNMRTYTVKASVLSATSLNQALRRAGFKATIETAGSEQLLLTDAPRTVIRREAELRSIPRNHVLLSWAV